MGSVKHPTILTCIQLSMYDHNRCRAQHVQVCVDRPGASLTVTQSNHHHGMQCFPAAGPPATQLWLATPRPAGPCLLTKCMPLMISCARWSVCWLVHNHSASMGSSIRPLGSLPCMLATCSAYNRTEVWAQKCFLVVVPALLHIPCSLACHQRTLLTEAVLWGTAAGRQHQP